MNIKGKYRIGLLSKLGRGSVLVSAAAVTGFALCAKYGQGRWKGSLRAESRPNINLPTANHQWDSNWDRRGNTKSVPSQVNDRPNCKRHIMLIRHGQYDTDGETDSERVLTDIGRYQASITGQRLNELNLPYIRMVSSTMSRAQETARLIHHSLNGPKPNLEYDDILEEGAPVDPIPPTDSWRPHPSQFFQDSARIENAFRKYFFRADPDQQEDSFEMLVCHANVIRFFVCRALQFPLSGWIRISLANCSLTMITIHPDGLVVVEMMGDHGHIPPERVTYH